MTYVQYPYEVLSGLGTNLNTVQSSLSDSKRGADDVNGLGSDGQDRIKNAIDDFRSTWKTSVGDLLDDIGHWGGLSKAIGDMVNQFDTQTAAALRPQGDGTGASGTGTTGPQ